MKVTEYTNKGKREENQDYVISSALCEGAGIYVVADGMGGYADGATASKVVADAIVEYARLNYESHSRSELLREAIRFANDTLMLKRVKSGGEKMGSVVTILLVWGDWAYLTWLGDSRIYMYRDGLEVYRTKDHSVINELVRRKSVGAADFAKYASMVTKAVMGDESLDVPPVGKIKIEDGDVFVMCTDGFYKEIDMSKAFDYDNAKRCELDKMADAISDNYSFIKVVI